MSSIIKTIIFFLSMIFIFSCKNTKERREVYEDGSVKEIHIYQDGVKVDSSIYYYQNTNSKKIRLIRYWYGSIIKNVYFNKNGKIEKEGKSLRTDSNFRIDKWHFNIFNNKIDSIVEYKNINGKPYVNQYWILNKNKDTIRGNYFSLYTKDTVNLGENVRLRFVLTEPFYNFDSDIEVIIPFHDDALNSDYSNLYKIERDTFFSLKDDEIPHPEIPKEVLQNQVAEFGFEYDNSGKKKIRGVLIEYMYDYLDPNRFNSLKKIKNPDSLVRIERRLFFEKEVFIKDTNN